MSVYVDLLRHFAEQLLLERLVVFAYSARVLKALSALVPQRFAQALYTLKIIQN
jgi:hypothetical protein